MACLDLGVFLGAVALLVDRHPLVAPGMAVVVPMVDEPRVADRHLHPVSLSFRLEGKCVLCLVLQEQAAGSVTHTDCSKQVRIRHEHKSRICQTEAGLRYCTVR